MVHHTQIDAGDKEMNCLGIDPGSNHVGLCYWCTGSAIRFATVNKSGSKFFNDIQADMDFIARIAQAIADIATVTLHQVVLEEPKDAQTHWSAGKGGAMAVGSLFAMGKGYGLCLAALRDLALRRGSAQYESTSYQVKSNKHGEGWQPRFKMERRPKGTPRPKGSPHKDLLLAQLRRDLHHVYATVHTRNKTIAELSEHELMAFGVLRYHLQKLDQPHLQRPDVR